MRTVWFLVLVVLLFGAATTAMALAQTDLDPIVVIEIGDPMDQRSIDYVIAALSDERAHAFVLQIDSPGVSSGDLEELYHVVTTASAPVVAWIGPRPAVAYGGSAYLVNHADIRTAAPGAAVGYLDPAVHKGDARPPSVRPGDEPDVFLDVVDQLSTSTQTVTPDDPAIYGFVDRLEPALGQLILGLDGETVVRGDEVFELSTADTRTIEGIEVPVATRSVKFIKPGPLDRFLRLGARPETAFLFLLFGISFAVFEFYAAGGGLMASVASVSLVLSGYGLATLPIRWLAVAGVAVGMVLLIWGFSQNRVDWRAALGSGLLVVSGLFFTTSRPQYPPSWWLGLVAVAGSVLFIWYALTTVVRGRFATPTVGREALVGRQCVTVSHLDPVGVVAIDGARWRATADRGIEILAGSPVEIVGVAGLLLEVDPVGRLRQVREETG